MALDGLSNQSVGIYRSKDPSQTTEKLNARSKEKIENNLSNVQDSGLIEKVDPDAKKEKEQENTKKFKLSTTSTQLIPSEDNEPTFDLVVEDENSTTELEYNIKFNSKTKLIELRNINNNDIVESFKPEELLRVISKAKMISGVLVDSKI